ncbi:glycosyltransferase family 4 protein [Pedobacter agri]|uniref:glycosyltransferase family 4 protein n=1 Tax=Pedobacter agri TaxID=454586 RepID=UPI00278164F2|nr:glycosyltransferase family 4 protein [Pedobacter agri]MDQ1141168.1 glycosyltransferase involved in cell wall biosynthesis [Pedobacter agri]
MSQKKNHVCYLTQAPGPYRERMHELLAENSPFLYSVIYCAELEPNRNWKLEYGKYEKHFLVKRSKTFRHNHPSVWSLLNRLDPSILIITAFMPTMLYGVLWCLIKRRKLIVYNDGTYLTERDYSWIQKTIRWFVFKVTSAFIGTGKGSYDLYKSYQVNDEKIFTSCLCIDNSKFSNEPIINRPFDIMYSGQITERKCPTFFADVAIRVKKEIPELKVLVVGDGPDRADMLMKLDRANVDYEFVGFLDQKTLTRYYTKAKIHLFTTTKDVWGVVANEACASGTPVITSLNAGAAGELIIDGQNGYVLDQHTEEWSDRVVHLLNSPDLLKAFSANATTIVSRFNHCQSAEGIRDAVSFVN